MISYMLHLLPFRQNQPLKSADDWYFRILKNKIIKFKEQEKWTLWLSHAICNYTEWSKSICVPDVYSTILRCTETFWSSCICKHINAVAKSVMLQLCYSYTYDMIFIKSFVIKYKFCIYSLTISPLPNGKKFGCAPDVKDKKIWKYWKKINSCQ